MLFCFGKSISEIEFLEMHGAGSGVPAHREMGLPFLLLPLR